MTSTLTPVSCMTVVGRLLTQYLTTSTSSFTPSVAQKDVVARDCHTLALETVRSFCVCPSLSEPLTSKYTLELSVFSWIPFFFPNPVLCPSAEQRFNHCDP